MAVVDLPAAEVPPVTVTKIGLVGFTASRNLAPWSDESWSLYGCNNLHVYVDAEKCAGWFDLHDTPTITKDAEHVKWLESTTTPVYTWNPQPTWTSSVRFPREEVLESFAGLRGARYFTNSISWMIAWAILQLQPAVMAGIEDVQLGVWGVDMAQGTEYAAQRPSCEYWLGIAEALGITVQLPETSDLLKANSLYGSDDDDALRTKLKARAEELNQTFADLQAEEHRILTALETCRNNMHQVVGARESNNYILGVWLQPEGTRSGADPVASDGSAPAPQGE